jgi:hypothetical protein
LKNSTTFDVVTDHYALVYLVTKPIRDSNGRLMRYIMNIQNYSFNLIHRKGGAHLDADAVSRLLRYDDEMLRILDRDRLVEAGVVTSKDYAELEEDGHLMLYPGIDTKTMEQMLDDLDIKRNRWGEDKQTVMSRIKLRHELELLVAMRDNDLDFINDMDPVLNDPEGTRHTERRLTFGKVSEKEYKDIEITTQIVRTADRDIPYNDQVVWDPFADEQPLVQRQPLRSSDTSWQPDREGKNGVEAETEAEAENGSETETEVENGVNLSPVEMAEEAERVVVNTEYNRHSREVAETVNVCPLGVKDYQKRRRGPRRTASQYRSAAGETIETVREIDPSKLLQQQRPTMVESTTIPEDEPYDEEDEATRAIIDKCSYLEGKLYIDNENKRLYMVTDLFWDKDSPTTMYNESGHGWATTGGGSQ